MLLCSCSKSASFVLEIPELTQGTVLVVSTNPEQIESGAMDTLAFAEFDGGRFETAFDSLKFEDKYMDCSVLIRTKEGKIAGNMVLPLERGKQTVVKVKDVVKFLNNESYLTIGYSGNRYAEDFSAFYSKLAGFEEMIVMQNALSLINNKSSFSSLALSTTSFRPSEECSVAVFNFGIEFSALNVASFKAATN